MSDNLLLARHGSVAVVTVDRPRSLNALDVATLEALGQIAMELQRDASVRAVVVTGGGEKAFVAGADIKELASLGPAGAREHSRLGQRVFDTIERMGKPVIAAVNGFALGGGCELAMACTLRIAADTARFAQPEIDLGLIPGFGGTQRLTRLVGKTIALELMLTGRQIGADEALRIGLVNRVVPSAELMPASMTLAGELAAKAPLAMRYIMDAVHRGSDVSLDEAQAIESALFGLVTASADMREGTRAFLDKRKPVFTGE